MTVKAKPRLRRVLLWGVPIMLVVCAIAILLVSLAIELGVKNVCAAAMREYPGDKVDALMKSVDADTYGYNARLYSANNKAFWALGQLGDPRAVPFLRTLLTGEECDHETNLCQGEIQEAMQKLEGNKFNLPKVLWRGVLDY